MSMKAEEMIHSLQSPDLKLISQNNNWIEANLHPPPKLIISITNHVYFFLPCSFKPVDN